MPIYYCQSRKLELALDNKVCFNNVEKAYVELRHPMHTESIILCESCADKIPFEEKNIMIALSVENNRSVKEIWIEEFSNHDAAMLALDTLGMMKYVS